MAQEEIEALVKLPADFPMHEVMVVGDQLRKADVMVADRPDPNLEVCSAVDHIRHQLLGQGETVLLPDRNVVSRMAQAAKGKRIDSHGRNAAAILVFFQVLEIQIEPSIAFHELAFNEGNDPALAELGWFRIADNGIPAEWFAAAMGVADTIATVGIPQPVAHVNLAKPLRRWRRNYVVALKMAELELNESLNAMKRVTILLEWMRDEFIIAGPAAMLAFLYFAPNSPPRKGLLKSLRSADRNVALNGVRNAAWDITYLSDFAKRINEASDSRRTRFILATFDQRLRDLARFVVGEYDDVEPRESLANSTERWWPVGDAQRIATLWTDCANRTRSAEWWDKYKESPDYVGELIAQYESGLANWKA